MKKILLFAVWGCLGFSAIPSLSFAQSYDEMIAYIGNSFEIDGSKIVISKIVEDIGKSKEDIFSASLSYASYAEKHDRREIEISDKERGWVSLRGLYKDFYSMSHSMYGTIERLSAPYVMSVDAKDNRMRIVVTIIECEGVETGPRGHYERHIRSLTHLFPAIAQEEGGKLSRPEKNNVKVWYRLFRAINTSFDAMEKIARGSHSEEW